MDDSTNDTKQQVIDSLKQANNILVTVKNSPTIDQLAACIGLTLILNDQGKHGTAVFSGEVPSVLEFLEPGKTLERNADSLQDFIISLDKSKADKLRYKVEDSTVRIFITPYKTSITEKDLEFGQGDFNVDVVVALGVHSQDDLDQAITAHGRILHDATVISMNTEPGGDNDLGSINWTDTDCSSLSEMVAGMASSLDKDSKDDKNKKRKDNDDGDDDRDNRRHSNVIDNQIATALLTGIVAETERFGNAKTTPATMETAAKLLAAGANQELVATKLAEPEERKHAEHEEYAKTDDSDDDNNNGDNNDSNDDDSDDSRDGDSERSEDDKEDEHDTQEHSDAPKSIYEESSDSDESGALMPSLLQSDDADESEPKDTSSAEETIDHSDDENEGDVATADLNNPEKPAGDGSLDIEHPEELSDHEASFNGGELQLGGHVDHHNEPVKEDEDLALAHAGSNFDMPQPTSDGAASLIMPLTPPIGTPSEPTVNQQATEAKNDDQADLDILKKNNPASSPKIQPIHAAHGVFIAPPAHDVDAQSASSVGGEGPSGGSPYGLTPPVMGGTLTSNSTSDHTADPMSSGASGSVKDQPATLTHSQPEFSKPKVIQPPVHDTTVMSPPAAPALVPASPSGPLIAPLQAGSQTLAQLEQNTNSPHAAAPGVTMDMPAPNLTPMLTLTPPIQPSEGSANASTPAAVPPTPPPIMASLIPPLSPTPPAAI